MVTKVQQRLVFPRGAAACSVAREMTEAGCRTVTIREPTDTLWLWEVASTAVYPVPHGYPNLLSPLI